MAAFDSNRPAVPGTLFGGRLGNFVGSVIAVIAAWNDARVTRNALSRLTDRELEDIGLTRGEINRIATGR